MGNAASSNAPSSLCQFNFLPSKVLTQTSLQPANLKKSTTGVSVSSDLENKSYSTETNPDKRDSPDSPDSNNSAKKPKANSDLTENDFHIVKVLGVEDCGRAYLVKKDDDHQIYTMKAISKLKSYSLGCVNSLHFEKEILKKANHPFLPKLKYEFENKKKVSFVCDYIKSEDLQKVLQDLTRFSEEITKFYSAEILLALEYLHKEIKASYDLNTKNIVFDSEGHIKLTNFSQSHRLDLQNQSETETSKREMIDFKDFGCLIYKLLTGQELLQVKEEVDANNLLANKSEIIWPQYIPKVARDLITRLTDPDIEERLGYNGFDEIKNHPFFEGIQWKRILRKQLYPPLDLSCHNLKTQNSEGALNISCSSAESCELDQILSRKPRDIIPDTVQGESFEHCYPQFNRLEE